MRSKPSIIAREKRDVLKKKVSETFLNEADAYLYDPGICIFGQARTAAETGAVTGMHDPTEGGLAGGLWELAERAGCGFEVDADRVTVLPHCGTLSGLFHLNPLKLIASGALLITVRPAGTGALESAFQRSDVALARIGRIIPDAARRIMKRGAHFETVEQPIVDEIHKIWE
ncbi:AIR synthase-related protein [candidate division KSB1 bacterium]